MPKTPPRLLVAYTPTPLLAVAYIRRILASRVPPLRFDDTPLQDVLDWVQDYSGALVTVRWGVLERCGIERETPVSLRVNGNQFAHVLAAVLDQAGSAAGVKLAYEASAEQFVFSTHADLSREMIVRVYDVRDLLIDIPMAPRKPPENFKQFEPGEVFHTHVHRTFVTPPPSLSPATPVSPGFPIGVVVRPEPLFPAPSGSTREIVSEDERLQEFMELILNSVEPDTWLANNADAPGTIFPYKGVLIVRNSRYVHQQIQDALSASRQHGPSAP